MLDYSGQFERGLRHGAGRETRGEDGAAVYEGQWQRDLRHGVGTARTWLGLGLGLGVGTARTWLGLG